MNNLARIANTVRRINSTQEFGLEKLKAPSFSRQMKELIGKITGLVLAIFYTIFSRAVSKEIIEDLKAKNKPQALQFAQRKQLDSSAVIGVLDELSKNHKNFTFLRGGLTGMGLSAQIDNLKLKPGQSVAIPVIIQGSGLFPRNHIVTFVVSKSNKVGETVVIDYYDSKGLTMRDRGNVALLGEGEEKLLDVCKQLHEKFKTDTNSIYINENETKNQMDFYNCGVYVCSFLEQIAQGVERKEFRPLCRAPTISEVNGEKREHFADMVKNLASPEKATAQNVADCNFPEDLS